MGSMLLTSMSAIGDLIFSCLEFGQGRSTPSANVESFVCTDDDADLSISGCAIRTWAINPLVDPPTHASCFWQNLHAALPETGLS